MIFLNNVGSTLRIFFNISDNQRVLEVHENYITSLFKKKKFMGQIGQFVPNFDLTMVCWKVELS